MLKRYLKIMESMIAEGVPPENDARTSLLRELATHAVGDALCRTTDLSAREFLPASQGREIVAQAWQALVCGDGAIRRIVELQQPDGALLLPHPSDSPELTWFHELALLHPLASYAMEQNDKPALAAVTKAALFHLHQTQPDHATNRPWAIHAFLLDPATYPFADAMLHAAAVQLAGVRDRVTLLLLADALYCGHVYHDAQSG